MNPAAEAVTARFRILYKRLEELRTGHGFIEGGFGRMLTHVDQWYHKSVSEYPPRTPDEEQAKKAQLEWQKRQITDSMPFMLRSALFLAGYTVLEVFLKSICWELESHTGSKLKDVEQKYKGIRRAEIYLRRAKLLLPPQQDWDVLCGYSDVRNAVGHAYGELSRANNIAAVRAFLPRTGTFTISQDDSTLELSENFNPQFVATVRAYAEKLVVVNGGDPTPVWQAGPGR